MKKLINWFSEHEGTLFLIFVGVSSAVFLGVVTRASYVSKARDKRASEYLVDHKCVTVSYAGKDAAPVYQCDNGLVMWKQIP